MTPETHADPGIGALKDTKPPGPAAVTLVIASLTLGGAERVLLSMAKYWVDHDRPVTLITMSDPATDFYSVDRRVDRQALRATSASRNLAAAVVSNARRLFRLRHAIRSAPGSVVISFGESVNVLCLIAAIGTGKKVVACERNDPRQHRIGRPWSIARRLTYRWADGIVVQTEGLRDWASTVAAPSKTSVIPNPAPSGCPGGSAGPTVRSRILGAGRLVDQKGFDTLLRAFAKVAPEHPDWDLVVIGDGPERVTLESLASELAISDRVSLPGASSEPAGYMSDSELFVLSSRYEGYPNVLLEAMACGMSVIATDCPSGPSEIVRDGHDGLLVPVDDVRALAEAMGRLMVDERERRAMGARALEVRERFSLDSIMSSWDRLLETIQAGRGA